MSISNGYRGVSRTVVVVVTCLISSISWQSSATVLPQHKYNGTSQSQSCISTLGSYKLNPPIYLPRGFAVRGLEVTPAESGFSHTVTVTYIVTVPEAYNDVYSFYKSVFKGYRARWKGYNPAGNGCPASFNFSVYPAHSKSNRYGVTYVIYKNALGPEDPSITPLNLTHIERKQTILYILAGVPLKFAVPPYELYVPVPHSRTQSP